MKKPIKNNLNITNILITLFISLIIVLIYYQFFFEYGVEKKHNDGEFKLIEIEDKCGMWAGQLQHTVSNEGECTSKCRAECIQRKSEFFNYTYTEGNADLICNQCYCVCK